MAVAALWIRAREGAEILHFTLTRPEKCSKEAGLAGGSHDITALVDAIGAAVVAVTKPAETLNGAGPLPQDRLDAAGPARMTDHVVVPVDAPGLARTVARQGAEIVKAAGARPAKRPNGGRGIGPTRHGAKLADGIRRASVGVEEAIEALLPSARRELRGRSA